MKIKRMTYLPCDPEIPEIMPASPLGTARVCMACGSVVINQKQHDAWHSHLGVK